MIQQPSDAVVINISPTMFFVSLGVITVGALVGLAKFVNWMSIWMTRVEGKVEKVDQLETDRDLLKDRMKDIEARANNTDRWIAEQDEDERVLKVAVAEFINDRRQGERRTAGGPI